MSSDHDLDDLLNESLKELKVSEASDSKKDEDASKTLPLLNEHALFSSTGPPPMPTDIDDTLNRLLKMTDDKTLSGMTTNANLDEVDRLIEEMMVELTSKELLAEPFSDLAQAYPVWLEKNRHILDSCQLSKFEKQCIIVCKIDALFKDPAYCEESDVKQKLVFQLMQEMQELGSPPEDLLKNIGGIEDFPQNQPGSTSECIQM